MHSPEVLVIGIPRPWPTIHKKSLRKNNPKWQLPIRRRKGLRFYWSHFAYFNGVELYWPSMIYIWHYEPGGRDALTVCRDTKKDKNGKWKVDNSWKWHFWHYKVSWPVIYGWRRWLFTRCAECGGPSRKGHMVNVSDGGWDGGPKTPLWCGEVHLFHSECLGNKNRRLHLHDPRGCYSCSGKASFEYNRNKPVREENRRVITGLFRDSHLERSKRALEETDDDE